MLIILFTMNDSLSVIFTLSLRESHSTKAALVFVEIVYSSLCIGIAPIDSVPISAFAIDEEHIAL